MIVSDKLSLEITFKSSNIQEGEKAALFKVIHCFYMEDILSERYCKSLRTCCQPASG